jgi:hypothetical protein
MGGPWTTASLTPEMLPLVWFALRHLGAVALLGWLATALGARLLRGLRFSSAAEALGVRAAVGLLALGMGGFVLGLASRLTTGAALMMLGAAALWSWRESRELGRDIRDLVDLLRSTTGPGLRRRCLTALAFGLVVMPMLALALYPPAGYDDLNYHLPYVRAFIEQQALVTVDHLRFPVFPQLNELLFTLMALVVDDVAAQSVQLLPALLVAVLVASWAARAGGRPSGAWAAALWLGNPLVVWMAGQAYIDLGLTLFVVAGFVCLERFRVDRARWFLALGGALLGAACGVKYLGVFALGLGMAHAWGTAPRDRRWRHAGVVLAVAAVVAAPWYVRIAWETGNPFFPYLRDVFGGPDWLRGGLAADGTISASGESPGWSALGRRLLEMAWLAPAWVVSLPVAVTWARDTFNYQAPHTPWTVVLVVAILCAARRDRRLLWLLAGCIVYAVLLLYTPRRDLRFLLPVAAAIAAGGAVALRPWVAGALDLMRRLGGRGGTVGALRGPNLVATVLLLAWLGPGIFYGGYKLWERGPIPVDSEERGAFLGRWVRGYRAVAFLDGLHPEGYTVYGVPYEPVRYYARGLYLGDKYGAYSYRQLRVREWRPEAVHSLLRDWEVQYLLVGIGYQATFEPASRCFVAVYRDEEVSVFRLASREDGSECLEGPTSSRESSGVMEQEGAVR